MVIFILIYLFIGSILASIVGEFTGNVKDKDIVLVICLWPAYVISFIFELYEVRYKGKKDDSEC